jgi:hypothetical protein
MTVAVAVLALDSFGGATHGETVLFSIALPKEAKASADTVAVIGFLCSQICSCKLTLRWEKFVMTVIVAVLALDSFGGATHRETVLFSIALPKEAKASADTVAVIGFLCSQIRSCKLTLKCEKVVHHFQFNNLPPLGAH